MRDYFIPSHILSILLTCRSDNQTSRNVIVKPAPGFLLINERDILKRFQAVSPFRGLIDDVQDPLSLILEYIDSNLFIKSAAKRHQSSEVEHIAKAILQALAALHEEGIVYTGT